MRHHIWKRLITVYIPILLILSLITGMIPAFAAEPAYGSENASSGADAPEEGSEEDYINQHLLFLETDDYKELKNTKGSEAGQIALQFDESLVVQINEAWEKISFVASFIGGKDVEMKNETDLVVTKLMMQTAQAGDYGAVFAYTYADSVDKMLTELVNVLESPMVGMLENVTENIIPQQAQDLINYAYAARVYIKESRGKHALVSKLTEECEEIIDNVYSKLDSFSKATAAFSPYLKGFEAMFKFGAGTADYLQSTYSDYIHTYVLYETCMSASEEWENAWAAIAVQARGSGSRHGTLLADSIERLLSEFKNARASDDYYQGVLNKVKTRSSMKNLAFESAEFGLTLLRDILPPGNYLRAILDGFGYGIDLSNALTNMDDVSYFCQMSYDTSLLALYSWDHLIKAGQQMDRVENYEAALILDTAFHIYKAIQISSFDYTIAYDQALLAAGLNQISRTINPAYSGSRETETFILQSWKAKWLDMECHRIENRVVLMTNTSRIRAERFSSDLQKPYASCVTSKALGTLLTDFLQDVPYNDMLEIFNDHANMREEYPKYNYSCSFNVEEQGLSGYGYGITVRGVFYSGGTRPWGAFASYNTDITDGSPLTWDDIVDPDALDPDKRLTEMLSSEIRKLYTDKGIDTSNLDFDAKGRSVLSAIKNGRWSFGSRGIISCFYAGEMEQYIFGHIRLLLPYNSLAGIVNRKYLPDPRQEKFRTGSISLRPLDRNSLEGYDSRRIYGEGGNYGVFIEGNVYNLTICESDVSSEKADTPYGSVVYLATHADSRELFLLIGRVDTPDEEDPDDYPYLNIQYMIYDEEGHPEWHFLNYDVTAGGEPVLISGK